MPKKFRVLRGKDLVFLLGGECQFYFYGREDFSEIPWQRLIRNVIAASLTTAFATCCGRVSRKIRSKIGWKTFASEFLGRVRFRIRNRIAVIAVHSDEKQICMNNAVYLST